ncbi:hypothetical protein [Smaragdicoccus niigatensis]|uniref:hypothetical protein n=1 Tax=Smaragdicoccus niigatensis TaxID=359359 RepID=UPI00036A3B0E|nr:hypothetical protein [Smaragdicoccus niigatensis]
MRIGSGIILIWLIIGAIAAGQRGYFTSSNDTCEGIGTVVLTVISGPLNYMGLNPHVGECKKPELPQPSP